MEPEFIALLKSGGFKEDFQPQKLSVDEQAVITGILEVVDQNMGQARRPRRYVLGLAFDFALVAQRLSLVDAQAKEIRRYRLLPWP